MSTETTTSNTPLAGAYLVKGTIGHVGMAGAPIVHFALVVTPFNHQVTGSVHITQAVAHGNYSGQVKGAIFATGLGDAIQAVSLTGPIYPDGPTPFVIPFEASLSIDRAWKGSGGFRYANVHVDNVPVANLLD